MLVSTPNAGRRKLPGCDMHPRVSAFLSARLIDRRGGHRRNVLSAFAAKRAFDALGPEQAEQKQREALARLLNHAMRTVPHVRSQCQGGEAVRPEEAMARLATMAIMRRGAIQRDRGRFVSEKAGPVEDDATGGSSGTPLVFLIDQATRLEREASLLWADHLAGWRYGDKMALLWGSDRDVQSATGNMRSALRWWIENRRWYNAFDMGPAAMARFHDDLNRFRPSLLVAYAGSLYTFAGFLNERGWQPRYPQRAMVSSAEMLTNEMRARVEAVFGRPVFDRYGNREAGAIAAECPAHEGLHVNGADFIVEIDSPDPYSTPGPLLMTYLKNYAMPFIRYDTGDLAYFSEGTCSCGRSTPRLARIVGRRGDTIRTASGRLIHGEYFTHLLYGTEAVQQFQFVQETPTDYRLLLVADPDAVRDEVEAWRSRILDAVGPGSRLQVEYVERIPTLPSGKRKFTLSKVGD